MSDFLSRKPGIFEVIAALLPDKIADFWAEKRHF
jgi:hypothetical protein